MIFQTIFSLIAIDLLIYLLSKFPQRRTLRYVCFEIKADITFNVYEIALVISIYLEWKHEKVFNREKLEKLSSFSHLLQISSMRMLQK